MRHTNEEMKNLVIKTLKDRPYALYLEIAVACNCSESTVRKVAIEIREFSRKKKQTEYRTDWLRKNSHLFTLDEMASALGMNRYSVIQLIRRNDFQYIKLKNHQVRKQYKEGNIFNVGQYKNWLTGFRA